MKKASKKESKKGNGYRDGQSLLLSFLAARNIPVDGPLRERIISCQDESLLNVWIARAATAKTAAEVVGSH